VSAAELPAERLPKVPAYAWSWLQRSRPVLQEAARRLTGAGPTAGFADDLRRRWDTDPFVRGVLLDVIADVAFSGRVPRSRPPGASWDRGLTWWAATLAGLSPQDYDRRAGALDQRALFTRDPAHPAAGPGAEGAPADTGPPLTGSHERRALAAALRDLLAAGDDQVPAAAVRRLLADLED
jgi:hypothetical protein